MKIFRIIFALTLLLVILSLIGCRAPCFHFEIEENVIPPTCVEEGMTVHSCKNCDYTYTTKTVPPKGHTLVEAVYSADCENQGYTKHACDCGYSYITDYVLPLGHTFEDKVTTPDCDSQGFTTHICKTCEYTYVDAYQAATGHSFSMLITKPECDAQGYTTYTCKCGFSYISDYTEATGHSFSSAVTAPLCEEQGFTTYTCKCGYSYKSEFVSPTGHKFEKQITDSTCTEQGYTTYTCQCGETYKSDYKAPLGHTLTEEKTPVTCTTEGKSTFTCECGYKFVSNIVAPTGHKFEKKITMPTVSNMGFTEFSCDCGFKYIGNYTFYSEILDDAYSDNATVLAKGIDIAEVNHEYVGGVYKPLDWSAIKAEGVEYVILKAGSSERLEYGINKGGISPTFELDYASAREEGLNIGAYFFTYATSVEEIRKDAELLLTILDGNKFEYPIYLDLEHEALADLGAPILTEMCMEFFTILQENGYYTGLYVNNNWLVNILQTEKMIDLFEIWYARYYPAVAQGDSVPFINNYVWNTEKFGQHLGMWQFTEKGKLNSIPHSLVDFDYSYKDYPTLIKRLGLNGYEAS